MPLVRSAARGVCWATVILAASFCVWSHLWANALYVRLGPRSELVIGTVDPNQITGGRRALRHDRADIGGRATYTPPDLRRLHIDAAALGFAVGRERLGIDGGWFASAPLSVVALLAGGLLAWRRLPTDVPVAPRLRAFNCARMALGGSAVCLVARLGGRLARKGDGPRGWPTLWRGWGDLHQGLPAPNSCSTDVYNDEAGGPCHDEVSRQDVPRVGRRVERAGEPRQEHLEQHGEDGPVLGDLPPAGVAVVVPQAEQPLGVQDHRHADLVFQLYTATMASGSYAFSSQHSKDCQAVFECPASLLGDKHDVVEL
jgi:hypothetical protein